MELVRDLQSADAWAGGYASIGNFDGVHRGHQTMMERLVQTARRRQRPALAVTFDPHPLEHLRPDAAPPRLTTLEHRAELIARCGVDVLVVLETTPALLQLTAVEFFEQIIVQRLRAAGLAEGPNFFFGRNRQGNITLLRGLCAAHGMTLDVIEPVTVGGQWVSSSVIRSLLVDGDVADAIELLGHPYRLSGRVGDGARRGRQLGFPTANLEDVPTVVPGAGVYGCRCVVADRSYLAALNIGPNPTFGEERQKIEAHLLDYDGDLYGRTLHLDLLTRVRDVRKFASVEELRGQLQQDLAVVRQRCSAERAPVRP